MHGSRGPRTRAGRSDAAFVTDQSAADPRERSRPGLKHPSGTLLRTKLMHWYGFDSAALRLRRHILPTRLAEAADQLLQVQCLRQGLLH